MLSRKSAVENRGVESRSKPLPRPLLGSWVSIAVHGALLLLFLVAGRHAWKVRPVTSRGGAHASVLYWQGGMGSGVAKSHVSGKARLSPARMKTSTKAQEQPKQEKPKLSLQPKPAEEASSQAGSTTSRSQLAGAGTGADDATPAFPTYSPNPPVQDRSLLPQSETNVVVDVNVSAQGEVLDEKLVQGLGNGLDQAILETVRSWHFHPATLNGTPVASVSELVFPMSQRYRG